MADVEEVVNLTKQLNQLVSVDTAVNYENMYEVKKLFMRVSNYAIYLFYMWLTEYQTEPISYC